MKAEQAEEAEAVEAVESAEAVEAPAESPDEPESEVVADRHEVFEATRPDGTVVIIDRNIETGEQTVTEKE